MIVAFTESNKIFSAKDKKKLSQISVHAAYKHYCTIFSLHLMSLLAKSNVVQTHNK